MSRVWITRPLTDAVMARAASEFDITVRDSTTPLDQDERRRGLRDYDVVMTSLGDLFSAEDFGAVPQARCRLLANFAVGVNHIDLGAAQAAGIVVTNTPGAVTDATADIAMTLLLMTARRAGEGERLVRAGDWTGWHPTQMLGQHVSGKRVGIIGMGRIGQAIARRCHHGFGMQVGYVARSPKSLAFPAKRAESVSGLAAGSDFLVVSVPGGQETHHLVNGQVLDAMPRHAILINIARGEVVDEAALIAALQTRSIAGAGLDVYEFEPHVPAALRALDTVTVLPHLGTATEEVRSAMGHMVLDNIAAFLSGEPVPNPVV